MMIDVIEGGLAMHEQVRLRLIRDVLNPATADEAFIKSDRLCAFGQWIYDPRTTRYFAMPEFQRFKAAHRMFHLAAHQALCLSRSGSCKAAFDSIESGPFENASNVLKAALTDLRRSLVCDDARQPHRSGQAGRAPTGTAGPDGTARLPAPG